MSNQHCRGNDPGARMTYTPAQRDAFLAAARERPRTLREVAEAAGLTVDLAREVLHRGYDAKRLRINDGNRQNIIIELIEVTHE